MDIVNLYDLFSKASGITTDSRHVRAGNIFFALKGERFNGNDYARQVIADGASHAVMDEKSKSVNNQCIIVDNVLETLQELARHHRRQINVKVLAITGTNGKTTTKELVNEVLSTTFRVHCTKGNYNNHIGVPLTLLEMPEDTEIAIIEMGANHEKEIDFLCKIAEPNLGLVTNVGMAHLEGFGDFGGVVRTKRELYDYLGKSDGKAFVNGDEEHLAAMSSLCKDRLIYSKDKFEDRSKLGKRKISLKDASPFLTISFREKADEGLIRTRLIGAYNFPNVLTAITIGRHFGINYGKIKNALEEYVPTNNRSQLVEIGSNKIILDAYNANPTSMKAALANFIQIRAEKKVAIIGDMLELGKNSKDEHLKIIQYAACQGLEQLITIGEEFKKTNQSQTKAYSTIEELKTNWDWSNYENTTFLIKGSRGIRLEKLLPQELK